MTPDRPGQGLAARAARTYGAAADHYDRAALGFWDRFGAATVSRLRLAAGSAVLGSGYRATVDALSPQHRAAVQRRVLARVHSANITALRTDVVFGMAGKAAGDA